MISTDQARRLGDICTGKAEPETLEEYCCLNAYKLRKLGYDMINIIDNMDPQIMEMSAHQLRHFLLGIAFAEKDIVEFEADFDIDEENKTFH